MAQYYTGGYADGRHITASGRSGQQGPQGLSGAGFKLTASGDYDIQNRKLINTVTDEAQDLSAVNMVTLKNKVHEKNKDIDLQDKYSIINSKQQSFTHLAANYDNLVSYADVKSIFLSRKETFPMETALDMGNHTIFNVKDPTVADQGVNKRYVDLQHSHSLLTDGTNYPMNHMNWNGKRIENLSDPVNSMDAVTKNYVDVGVNKFKFDSDTNDRILDSKISTKLALSGGTMTSQISMGGNKIVNVATPTNNTDATNKLWVDNQVGIASNKQILLEEKLKDIPLTHIR